MKLAEAFPSPHGDISSKYTDPNLEFDDYFVSVPSRGYQFKIRNFEAKFVESIEFPSPHGDISSKSRLAEF